MSQTGVVVDNNNQLGTVQVIDTHNSRATVLSTPILYSDLQSSSDATPSFSIGTTSNSSIHVKFHYQNLTKWQWKVQLSIDAQTGLVVLSTLHPNPSALDKTSKSTQRRKSQSEKYFAWYERDGDDIIPRHEMFPLKECCPTFSPTIIQPNTRWAVQCFPGWLSIALPVVPNGQSSGICDALLHGRSGRASRDGRVPAWITEESTIYSTDYESVKGRIILRLQIKAHDTKDWTNYLKETIPEYHDPGLAMAISRRATRADVIQQLSPPDLYQKPFRPFVPAGLVIFEGEIEGGGSCSIYNAVEIIQPGRRKRKSSTALAGLPESGRQKISSTRQNKLLAVKVMRHDDAETIKDAQLEAGLLARLQHPSILSLVAFEQYTMASFIFTPKIHQLNLMTILQERDKPEEPVPLPIVKSITLQMLSAISYCHAQHIIHHDIKSSNILADITSPDEKAILTDFGGSEYCPALPTATSAKSQNVTSLYHTFLPTVSQPNLRRSSRIKEMALKTNNTRKRQCISRDTQYGTPVYVAPDHNNPFHDETVDVYAMGVVMLDMLACTDDLLYTEEELAADPRRDYSTIVMDKLNASVHKVLGGTDESFERHYDVLDMISHMITFDIDKRYTAEEALQVRWLQE